MDESLTAVILLCMAAVILAAILGVLSYGADQASDIANGGYTFFDDLKKPEPLGAESLSDRTLPVAAVAAVMRHSKEQIASLDCQICHTASSGDDLGECLNNHLRGRGVLILTADGEDGYAATLLPAVP